MPLLVSVAPQYVLIMSLCFSVTSQCTALLSQKSDVRGGSDSSFSLCAAPTYYCRSEYFYSQCPQVWKSIGMEHSLNRGEPRVKNKARVISNNSEIVFWESECCWKQPEVK